jgi:hypothetical protein
LQGTDVLRLKEPHGEGLPAAEPQDVGILSQLIETKRGHK